MLLPMRAKRSVENGVTIAPDSRATMYDQMGNVVSPLSTLIRPTETPKDVRRTSDSVRTSHPLAPTGDERWARDQQSYVPPPMCFFVLRHGNPVRIRLRLSACMFEGRDDVGAQKKTQCATRPPKASEPISPVQALEPVNAGIPTSSRAV